MNKDWSGFSYRIVFSFSYNEVSSFLYNLTNDNLLSKFVFWVSAMLADWLYKAVWEFHNFKLLIIRILIERSKRWDRYTCWKNSLLSTPTAYLHIVLHSIIYWCIFMTRCIEWAYTIWWCFLWRYCLSNILNYFNQFRFIQISKVSFLCNYFSSNYFSFFDFHYFKLLIIWFTCHELSQDSYSPALIEVSVCTVPSEKTNKIQSISQMSSQRIASCIVGI